MAKLVRAQNVVVADVHGLEPQVGTAAVVYVRAPAAKDYEHRDETARKLLFSSLFFAWFRLRNQELQQSLAVNSVYLRNIVDRMHEELEL